MSVGYIQFFGQQLPTSDLNSLQPVVSHQLCTLLLVSVSEMSVNLIIFVHRGGELTRISGTACSDCIYQGISKTARRQKQALTLAEVQPPAQAAVKEVLTECLGRHQGTSGHCSGRAARGNLQSWSQEHLERAAKK